MNRESLMMCLTLTGGFGLGALTMYFFDPARGHGRRALCMDQLSSAANTVKGAVESSARDLKNRARGRLAEARSAVSGGLSPKAETAQGGTAAA